MSSLNVLAFKGLLFADQKLEDLPIEVETQAQRSSPSTWKYLLNARSLLAENREEEAVRCLKDICASGEIGTRPKLWSWFNLRRFGIFPEISDGSIIRGVVLEVRAQGGIDVLAAYEDNSVRYLNFTGKIIVWDLPDREVDPLCKNLLLIASRTIEFSTKNYTDNPQVKLLRVSLLTFNGNHRIEGEPNNATAAGVILGQLFKGGAILMNTLINRSKAMNSVLQPPKGPAENRR